MVILIIINSLLSGFYYAARYSLSTAVYTKNFTGPNSGHFIYYPSFKAGSEIMIFLVSTANPRYGFNKWNDTKMVLW